MDLFMEVGWNPCLSGGPAVASLPSVVPLIPRKEASLELLLHAPPHQLSQFSTAMMTALGEDAAAQICGHFPAAPSIETGSSRSQSGLLSRLSGLEHYQLKSAQSSAP